MGEERLYYKLAGWLSVNTCPFLRRWRTSTKGQGPDPVLRYPARRTGASPILSQGHSESLRRQDRTKITGDSP